MVLGEAHSTHVCGKRGNVDGASGTQHVHTRRNGEPASGGAPGLRVAGGNRLNAKGSAEVRQREGHGPGTADRARHDLVAAWGLERIAHRYGVGVDLESPDARPHLVQEVDPLPSVRRHRR